MNETQKRIKTYREMLPELRKRITAAVMLLLISAVMVTSASFAWVTVSTAPELSGVTTTVAANGNLEIALASPSGGAPGESNVGDSSAREGQEVTAANLTWGNLVNLSDSSYGLSSLVLRPAQLNEAALLDSPLYGAEYTSDGRIVRLTSNFAYTKWVKPQGNVAGYFELSSDYGVRAISSTKVEAVGLMATYLDMVTAANSYNTDAGNRYKAIGDNQAWMESLAFMMGTHMNATLNAGDTGETAEKLKNPSIDPKYVTDLIEMYGAFIEAFELEGQALATMANLQLYLQGDVVTKYTMESLLASTTTASILAQQGVRITDFVEFQSDYHQMKSNLGALEAILAAGSITWKGELPADSPYAGQSLYKIINALATMNDCTIDGKRLGSLGTSDGMDLNNKTKVPAVITNGVLWEFERRTGANIKVGPQYNKEKGLKLEASVIVAQLGNSKIDGTLYAYITTNAPKPALFITDMEYTATLLGENSGEKKETANDTYGLAIDFWVRTNASGSYLKLEGNVLTSEEQVRAKGKDANGNEVELYTLTIKYEVGAEEGSGESGTEGETTTDGETAGETITVTEVLELYRVEDGDTVTWYNHKTHAAMTDEEMEGKTPNPKMETVITVEGFEGVNRVWENSELISTDATTQGSGSCYIYYVDNPEDQVHSLELLKAFNVAFVDDEGNLLAVANMDTDRAYFASGRVIVPLVLSSRSLNIGEDADGNPIYAITALEKNVPVRLTAIVFLDGSMLTNEQVLAAADIQGQLNIQFGSTSDLLALGDEELENAVRSVTASVDKNTFNYDTATEPMTVTVSVNVEGEQPSTVKAFFLREINANQGSREREMTFTKNADGVWTATYTFDSPGKYVLRTVQLDGMDYDLETIPTVTVSGFAIESLNCQEAVANHVTVMTADGASSVHLSMKFATNDPNKLPNRVQGRFLRDDGTAVDIPFTYNATTGMWNGMGTFLTSGEYILRYLVLDGKYTELPANLHQTATVYLGMKVAVYTTSPTTFKFLPSEMTEAMKALKMQVSIMDNIGNELPGLTGAELVFNLRGSGIKTMDGNLTWNGITGYYECTFRTEDHGAGIFQFSHVTVGANTITNATTSPTFTIISPEPPQYYDFLPNTYQFVPEGGATLNVRLGYSGTATVLALIRNADTNKLYPVLGEILPNGSFDTDDGVPITTWVFDIPANAAGKQDGNWTMEQVYLWNYYNEDSEFIEAELNTNGFPKGVQVNDDGTLKDGMLEDGILKTADGLDRGLIFDMTDEGNSTKVVQTVYVVFSEDRSENFSGSFLQTYTVSGLSVQIRDFAGNELPELTDVKLTYTYGGDSKAKGGYTGNFTVPDIVIAMTPDSAGTTFTQSGTQTLKYAGTYRPALTFKVSGITYSATQVGGVTLTGTVPAFTVSSTAPAVAISAIGPTGTFSVDVNTSGAAIADGFDLESRSSNPKYRGYNETHENHLFAANNTEYIPSKTATAATVYFKCTHQDVAKYGYTGWQYTRTLALGALAKDNVVYRHDYEHPWVRITLSGFGYGTGATLTFTKTTTETDTDTTVHLYAAAGGPTASSSYSWTANGDATMYVGKLVVDNSKDDAKTVAGTLTATQLVLTDGTSQYTVDIADITITNTQ